MEMKELISEYTGQSLKNVAKLIKAKIFVIEN